MPPKARPIRTGIMLCQPLDQQITRRYPENFFTQPKLNGDRCRVEWHGETPYLISSYGNIFTCLPHIEEQIKRLDKETFSDTKLRYDGELYVHGWERERIHSAVSRKVNTNKDSKLIEFHIFDFQLPVLDQTKRIELLHRIPQHFYSHLRTVPTHPCTKENYLEHAAEFLKNNYEGAIFRHPEAVYTYSRPFTCIKFKPTEEDEYTITGVVEAYALDGTPKGMVGAFQVKDTEGNSFEVGAGKLTHAERTTLWQQRQLLTNLSLITKHELLRTKNSIPVSAVAVQVKGLK